MSIQCHDLKLSHQAVLNCDDLGKYEIEYHCFFSSDIGLGAENRTDKAGRVDLGGKCVLRTVNISVT